MISWLRLRATNNSSMGEEPVLFDDHSLPHASLTVHQLALIIIWLGSLLLWLQRMPLKYWTRKPTSPSSPSPISSSTNNGPKSPICNGSATPISADHKLDSVASLAATAEEGRVNEISNGGSIAVDKVKDSLDDTSNGSKATNLTAKEGQASGSSTKAKPRQFSEIKPPPTFDAFLGYVVVIGLVLMFFGLCDYLKIFPNGEREYKRDTFLFLVFMFFLVASAFTMRTTSEKILNRDQTEEWKGWMQVMFVWYHYFAAKEWYNWIRVYIACYVWMTGFGNFSFFWVRKDFSLWRVVKMLFRLNFLVILICFTVSNQYMAYYICAMHTYWFLSVYATMAIFPSWNQCRWRMPLKFVIYAVFNALIFDIPGVARTIFRPFSLVFGYNYKAEEDQLHEWEFRGRLDHWVCFVGMLCAYNYPTYEAFLNYVEKRSRAVELAIKASLLAGVCVVFAIWHQCVLSIEEKELYNFYHPYTSFVPILCYIVVRNLFPQMRTRYLEMFAWLGKITLETYLSQLHIYLQSNARHLLVLIRGDNPLLNFSLATIVYLAVSYLLFRLTTEISAYLLPHDNKAVLKNVFGIILAAALATGIAIGIQMGH